MVFLLVASYPESLLNFRGPLLDAVLARGLTVHVAAPDLPEGSVLRQNMEAKGLNVHSIPLNRTGTNPLTDFVTFLYLLHLIYRIQPDFLLAYTVKPVIYSLLASKIAGIKHRYALITGLGYAFQDTVARKRGFMSSLVKHLYTLSLGFAHKVFFQNSDDQAFFYSNGILTSSTPSYVVNGSGVDIEKYALSSLPNRPHFLLIARLLGSKGLREYVEAARRVKTIHPEVVFSLAGWLDENPDAISEKELIEWQNEGTINYMGVLSDVRPAISASSVYVLPSYREGTPRTVLEAMAMGRPIITTDVPGCRQTVLNGENGYLVPAKNVNELAHAMLRFIEQPHSVVKMGARSRQLAEEKYDVHLINKVMLREMKL